MRYNRFDIMTLDNNEKVVVLEVVEFEGETYLYVDKVTEDEKDTLGKYHILKVYEDNIVQKETDTDTLIKILPLFSKNVKINYE